MDAQELKRKLKFEEVVRAYCLSMGFKNTDLINTVMIYNDRYDTMTEEERANLIKKFKKHTKFCAV